MPGDLVVTRHVHGLGHSVMSCLPGDVDESNPKLDDVPDGQVCIAVALFRGVLKHKDEVLIVWNGTFGWIGLRNVRLET